MQIQMYTYKYKYNTHTNTYTKLPKWGLGVLSVISSRPIAFMQIQYIQKNTHTSTCIDTYTNTNKRPIQIQIPGWGVLWGVSAKPTGLMLA